MQDKERERDRRQPALTQPAKITPLSEGMEFRRILCLVCLHSMCLWRGRLGGWLEGDTESHRDEDLQFLFKAIATIPISTSEYEQNFSSMNDIVTPNRTTLNIQTLFINCVGPPLSKFNPDSFVRSWLCLGRHSADDTASRKCEKKEDTTYEFLWKIL